MIPPAPLSEAVTTPNCTDDSSMVSGEKVSLEELQRQIAESEGSRETKRPASKLKTSQCFFGRHTQKAWVFQCLKFLAKNIRDL